MTDDRTAAPPGPAASPVAPGPTDPEPSPPPRGPAPAPRRPLVERVGMAVIAAFLAGLFAAVGAASWLSGEPFLGVMALIGALMTAWVGIVTLLRG